METARVQLRNKTSGLRSSRSTYGYGWRSSKNILPKYAKTFRTMEGKTSLPCSPNSTRVEHFAIKLSCKILEVICIYIIIEISCQNLQKYNCLDF